MKQKWGGFKGTYTPMATRDPWPNVPFADTVPVVPRRVFVGVIILLAAYAASLAWWFL